MKQLLYVTVFFLAGLAIVLGYRYFIKTGNFLSYQKPAVSTKFSLVNAPSLSLRGNIATLSGTVAWLSRTAAKPVAIKSPRAIQQGESVSTGADGNAVILIKDHSVLSLSPNTHLSIIQLLPQNFVFDQEGGTVRYQNTLQTPLSIKSSDLLTIITQGIAAITQDPKLNTVSIAVEKGQAKEGYEDLQNNSTVVNVAAGQTFFFDDTTKTAVLR